jgi:hypothetical protein
MSTTAVGPQPVPQHNIPILTSERHDEFQAHLHQRIAERAFQLFEKDGADHGNDQNHWVQAEAELMQRATDVREAGSWISANASLSAGDADELQVLPLSDRAIVSGVRLAQGQGPVYLVIPWPVSIDPGTIAAYLKGRTLTVTAKHNSSPGNSTVPSPEPQSPPPNFAAAPQSSGADR